MSEMAENVNIIPRGSIADLVQEYEAICAMVDESWSLLKQADARLKRAIGGDDRYSGDLCTWKLNHEFGAIKPALKRKFWDHVIARSGIKNVMHHQVRRELENQMRHDQTMPAFSTEVIHATLYGWAESSQDVFTQMCQETFKLMLPWRGKYKTNKLHRIDKRIVMEGAMGWYTASVGEYATEKLRDLDRIFHQLDSKTPPEYPHDLVSVINDEARLKNEDAETEYFYARWFKNKNIHLTFKRLDLLAEFNRIGAGGSNAIGKE
jgi:hypothetical protein